MSFLFNALNRVIVLLFFILNVGKLCACDCAPQSIEQGFNSASVVLEGQIISEESWYGNGVIRSSTVAYKIKVLDCFKGNLESKELTVYTYTGSSCSYGFEVGKQYMIYANSIPPVPDSNGVLRTGNYSISVCSRTTSAVDYECDKIERLLANAKEEERMRYFFSNESIFMDTFLAVEKSMREQFRKAMRD